MESEIVRLEIKKALLHSQVEELKTHHLFVRTLIDALHTEKVLVEERMTTKLKKAQEIAEKIDELTLKP
jgi:hypothetical protein